MTTSLPEQRLDLIHRVIVPDNQVPAEYAILLTSMRSIFIRQARTRSPFVLRREISYGTALVTDVVPKTLADYQDYSLDELAANTSNIAVPHESIVSLEMKKDKSKPSRLNFVVRLAMKMQKEDFQVYNFELKYHDRSSVEKILKFYAVPLGAYFKPKRQTQDRDTILREYATEVLETFRRVLPAGSISSLILSSTH